MVVYHGEARLLHGITFIKTKKFKTRKYIFIWPKRHQPTFDMILMVELNRRGFRIRAYGQDLKRKDWSGKVVYQIWY